jgi:diaminopimelate decarboxylase
MLYDAFHPMWPVRQRPDAATVPVDIVGPVCETTDTFARDRDLALPQPGDLLAILGAGAYGMSMASNYNSRPRAAEVLVTPSGEGKLIRARETFEDLVRGESLLP